MSVKRLILVVSILFLLAGLLSGCSGDSTTPGTESSGGEAVPTLTEVLSGTWKLYAGFDQSGNLVYVSADSADLSYTFDANGGFTGVYRDDAVNAKFSGEYDCSNSMLADKNPYNWYYYATIDANSIEDSGQYTLMGRLGEQGLHLIFKLRDLEGEQVLYEEMQGLYFKR